MLLSSCIGTTSWPASAARQRRVRRVAVFRGRTAAPRAGRRIGAPGSALIVEGHWSRLVKQARRLLALDPLHEPAHRVMMLLYAWTGQPAAALRQYRECLRLLNDELGVPPCRRRLRFTRRSRNTAFPHRHPRHQRMKQHVATKAIRANRSNAGGSASGPFAIHRCTCGTQPPQPVRSSDEMRDGKLAAGS